MSKLRSTLRLFLLVLLCLSVLVIAHAQSSSSTLSGTIVDQNGAAIPGATVTLTNTANGLQRQTTTNGDGSFTIPLLPPSTYMLLVEQQGFASAKVSDVVLNVGDQKALQIQLKAGDVNAQVTVDSNAETLRTDGSVGTVVNRQFVANIPLNGRSLQALIQLTPGVVLTPAPSNSAGATGSQQFNVNGQRTTANYFMVDGVSANTGISAGTGVSQREAGSGATPGTTALGGTNSLVSLDALQEFRIETSTYGAEFGRTPGGQISLVTRGGTNQFHGSASEYFRNEALDANDWFANATRQPKPRERQNLFGGVFGGPIRKDRLFFFGSYEGLRLQQPQVGLVAVPSTVTRAQAVTAVRPYLDALPLPNGQDFRDGTSQFAASYSNPGRFNIVSLRIDGRVTNKLTGFFRFNHAPSESKARIGLLSSVESVQARNDSYTGGVTWIAGSRLTADVRFNWTRNAVTLRDDLDAFGGAVVPRASQVFLQPNRDPSNENLGFVVNDLWFAWGVGSADVQRQFNLVGSAGLLVGSHQMKFGADYRRMLPLFAGSSSEQSVFLSPDDLVADMALFYSVTSSDGVRREPIISNLSLFAQDTWRVSPSLTLTYGLRFERVPPPSEANGRLPRTLLGIEGDVLQNPRLAPPGTQLFRSAAFGFAPRLGVAYQFGRRTGWETILRGGVGSFYDSPLGSIADAFDNAWPFSASSTACCFLPFPLSDADRPVPVPGEGAPSTLFLLDPNIRLPFTAQWNAAWEQEINATQSLIVSYVGAAGHRLMTLQRYQNQTLADFPTARTSLFIQRNRTHSGYQGLQVQYQRRLRRGIQALASYTLGRSRDNASDSFNIVPPASDSQLLAQQYGPSTFDVRHVFSGAVTYDLPKLSGAAPVRALLNGWGFDLLIRYQSAFPVNPKAGFAAIGNVLTFIQPNLVFGQPLYISDPTTPTGRRFNPAAFTAPPAGQMGNFARNGLRGFPASQADLSLHREFKLGDQARLQLRGELFNMFNHPNFGSPSDFIRDPNFGRPSSMLNRSLGGLNALYQMGGPRSGELAIKIIF
jgi:Carboxypeptidase regulatory-like domain/TonB-dependent Receptor Plug Domain